MLRTQEGKEPIVTAPRQIVITAAIIHNGKVMAAYQNVQTRPHIDDIDCDIAGSGTAGLNDCPRLTNETVAAVGE